MVRGSRAGLWDSAIALGGQAGTAIVGVITSVLLARTLSPADVGTYALVISMAAFVAGLSDMGISQTAIRYGSRSDAAGDERTLNAVVRWAVRRRFALTLIIAGAGALVGPACALGLWGAPEVAWLVPVAVLAPVTAQLGSNVPAYLQARGRFGSNTTANLLTSGTTLLALLCVAELRLLSVRSVVLVSVLSPVVSGVAIQALVPPSARLWSLLREHRASVPEGMAPFARMMVFTAITAQVLLNADLWILGALVARDEVATYALAVRFTLPLSLATGAIGSVLWTRFATAAGELPSQMLGSRLMRMAFLGVVPIVIYSLAVPSLAPTLFGARYQRSVLLGQVLCLRYAVALFSTIVTGIGFNFGLGSFYPLVNLGRLVVLGASALALSSRYGAMSLALGLVLSEAFLLSASVYLIRRRLRPSAGGPQAVP